MLNNELVIKYRDTSMHLSFSKWHFGLVFRDLEIIVAFIRDELPIRNSDRVMV